MGVFIIQVARSCHLAAETDELIYVDLTLRCLFLLVEFYMVLVFLSVLSYMKTFKITRQKVFGKNSLSPKQQGIYVMLFSLAIAHLLGSVLDLNYPIGLLLSGST